MDKKTRALFVDFTYYNDDLALFVSSNILVEFVSGHAPVTTVPYVSAQSGYNAVCFAEFCASMCGIVDWYCLHTSSSHT